jgi:hypothetical protein
MKNIKEGERKKKSGQNRIGTVVFLLDRLLNGESHINRIRLKHNFICKHDTESDRTENIEKQNIPFK